LGGSPKTIATIGVRGTHKLIDEQLNDPTMHHFANAEDLEYEAINADLMLALFADHKVLTGKKKEGKFWSESDMKKFSQCILFGAREARKALLVDYHVKVEDFMKAYTRKIQLQRKQRARWTVRTLIRFFFCSIG
jgi:hypothetical protein